MSEIKGYGDWIMIKEHSLQKTTDSGIITDLYGIHGKAGEEAEYLIGTVHAVGPKVLDIKIGDTVLYDPYNGGVDEIGIDGTEYFFTRQQYRKRRRYDSDKHGGDNIWAVIDS